MPGYIASFVLLFIVSATTAASAYMMESVINEIFVDRQRDMIWAVSGIVAAIFILKGAAAYGNAIILARIGNNIVANIQKRMFRHVMRQGNDFYVKHALGELTARFTNNAAAARDALNLIVLSFARDTLSLVGLIVVMIIQDPVMSFITLVIAPIAIYGTMILMKRVKAIAKAEFAGISRIITIVKESYLGIRVVKSFQMEPHLTEQMTEAVHSVETRLNEIAKAGSLTVPMMESLGGLAVAAAIVYGGLQVVGGQAEPGAVFSFMTAVLMAYEPARRLSKFNVEFQVKLVGTRMLYELLDTPPSQATNDDGPALAVTKGEVSFDHVDFAYSDVPTLSDLSLTMGGGRITALVGPSGAGKSTIFALIERFYDPQRGRILIDGQDIGKVQMDSLRSAISYVSQDSFLFEGSVRENIAFGKPGATNREITSAAKAANAHEFIQALPRGYKTEVGEGGSSLSGGQRQRVAIARALLRDTPILLLDEATSALDSVSEAKVQEALGRLMHGRTTIVIAHRLSTVRHADQIHVIDHGHLAESGTHDQLIARNGVYAKIYALQFQDQDDNDAPPVETRKVAGA
ncbi:MAG: ABC transporter ATP-binding protein [Geminicoccaceae bacterium]